MLMSTWQVYWRLLPLKLRSAINFSLSYIQENTWKRSIHLSGKSGLKRSAIQVLLRTELTGFTSGVVECATKCKIALPMVEATGNQSWYFFCSCLWGLPQEVITVQFGLPQNKVQVLTACSKITAGFSQFRKNLCFCILQCAIGQCFPLWVILWGVVVGASEHGFLHPLNGQIFPGYVGYDKKLHFIESWIKNKLTIWWRSFLWYLKKKTSCRKHCTIPRARIFVRASRPENQKFIRNSMTPVGAVTPVSGFILVSGALLIPSLLIRIWLEIWLLQNMLLMRSICVQQVTDRE